MPRSPSPAPWILVGLLGLAALAAGLVMLLGDEPAPPEPEPVVLERGAPDAPRPELPDVSKLPPPQTPVPADEVAHLGTIRGRLVTGQRQVVESGRVSVHAGMTLGFLGGGTRALGVTAEVDDSGRFELRDVPARADLLLRADGERFALTEVGPFQLDDGEVLDVGNVVVEPGLNVVGRVLGTNARPVAGARVGFDPSGRALLEGGVSAPKPELVVLTDEDGRFELLHLDQANYVLLVSAEGYANQIVQPDVWENFTESFLEHTIWLEPVTPLTGRVWAKESGKPVPGMTVSAVPTGPTRGHEVTTTDADGRFRFDALVKGHYKLLAEGEGRAPGDVHVAPADFGAADLELWLEPTGTLVGTVVGPEGEPVTRYEVAVRYSPNRGPLASAHVATDRVTNGPFRFDDLRAGYYTLEVWAPGYAPLVSEPRQLAAGETATTTVRLEPAAILRGRVIDERENPVRGAKVSLHTNQLAGVSWLRGDDDGAVWYKTTTTDVNGRFELVDVMARRYQVEVDHPDYALQHRNDVVAREGQTRELPPFVLEIPGRIEGVVYSDGGSPLAGAMVNCGGRDRRDERVVGHTTRTNAKGEYSFRRLPPGEYVLEAWVPFEKGEWGNPMDYVVADAERAYAYIQNPDDVRVMLGPGETRVKHLTAFTP